jgi:hypothetical protein
MQHDRADGDAARIRAVRTYAAGWHPILAAVEVEPGHWRMIAQYDAEYGDVRLVKRGPDVGYRVDDSGGELVGYYRTLRAACEAVHLRYVRTHGAPERPR